MFAPGFVTGWLITRFGTLNVITAVVAMGALCVAINLTGETLWHFRLSMALVGVGWNFMFIGGTTMLTSIYTPAEKAKTAPAKADAAAPAAQANSSACPGS